VTIYLCKTCGTQLEAKGKPSCCQVCGSSDFVEIPKKPPAVSPARKPPAAISGSWLTSTPVKSIRSRSGGRVFFFRFLKGLAITALVLFSYHLACVDKGPILMRSSILEEMRSAKQTAPQHKNRQDARRLNEQALELFRQGKYTQSAEVFRNAHEKDPGDIEIYNNLGQAQLEAGRLKDAETTINAVLRYSPERGVAYYNLAQIRARQNRKEEALDCLAALWEVSRDRNKTLGVLKNRVDNKTTPESERSVIEIFLRKICPY